MYGMRRTHKGCVSFFEDFPTGGDPRTLKRERKPREGYDTCPVRITLVRDSKTYTSRTRTLRTWKPGRNNIIKEIRLKDDKHVVDQTAHREDLFSLYAYNFVEG